jgi:multidrug efflux pump subunit AcrA (membrane-fusion protein)
MKCLVLVCCLFAACTTDKVENEPVPTPQPSAATRWVPARSALGLSWLEAPGRVLVSANAVALVSAPLSARVVRVRVRPGQQVELGDALVEVVMPELMRAAGMLRAADIRLAALSLRHQRLLPLLEQGLARAAEVSDLEASIALARADRESARATLRSAGESDERAAKLVEGTGSSALRAPLAGMVVAVSAQLGQVREPASGPLVEIVGEAPLQIEARFTAEPPVGASFVWIELGRVAQLVLEATSPRAGLDGSRQVWLHPAEGVAAPSVGALGRVRIVAPDDWVVVPVRALLAAADTLHVSVKRPQGSALVPVVLVRRSETEAVVTGLPAGSLVAADASSARKASGAGELTP